MSSSAAVGPPPPPRLGLGLARVPGVAAATPVAASSAASATGDDGGADDDEAAQLVLDLRAQSDDDSSSSGSESDDDSDDGAHTGAGRAAGTQGTAKKSVPVVAAATLRARYEPGAERLKTGREHERARVAAARGQRPGANDLIEPHTKLRLMPPRKVGSAELEEKISAASVIPLEKLHRYRRVLKDPEGDCVVFGVVGHVSERRTARSGKDYAIIELADLSATRVSVFLFGKACDRFGPPAAAAAASSGATPLSLGSLVCIANPTVLEQRASRGITLSMNKARQMLVIGQARDFGRCNAIKKARTTVAATAAAAGAGQPCNAPINKGVDGKRTKCDYHLGAELRDITNTRRALDQTGLGGLRHLVAGTTGPSQTTRNLSSSSVLIGGRRSGDSVATDARRRATATGRSTPEISKLIEQRKMKNSTLQRRKDEYSERQKREDRRKEQDLIPVRERKKKFFEEVENGASVPARKKQRRMDGNLPMHPMHLSRSEAAKASKAAEIARSHAAIRAHQLGGAPIEKPDPNSAASRMPSRVQQRVEKGKRDAAELAANARAPPRGVSDLLARNGMNDEAAARERRARNNEVYDEYERKEAVLDHMEKVKYLVVKAWSCKDCKRLYSGQGTVFCKKNKHRLKKVDATKRFFACANCSKRHETLDEALPRVSCHGCGRSEWKAASMCRTRRIDTAGNADALAITSAAAASGRGGIINASVSRHAGVKFGESTNSFYD